MIAKFRDYSSSHWSAKKSLSFAALAANHWLSVTWQRRNSRETSQPVTCGPYPEFRGKVQKMTTDKGEQKGLQQTLEEQGFDVTGMRAKCSPVCPWENEKCCIAWLLSKQEDFVNQISMLETLIKEAGHECLFLPKFHCELNPIEMVRLVLMSFTLN